MRLGKEQAVGYVEDTDYLEDTGSLQNTGSLEHTGAVGLFPEEPVTAQTDGMPLTAAAEHSLTGS